MRTSATLALLIACAATLPASAQEPAARDRTVYVPIEDFDKIFDKDKGGVFVPYSELRELIRRAQKNRPPVLGSEAKPPTDYLLVGARFDGRAGERVVQFTATFDVEVLAADQWVVVPIGLEQASLEEVRTTGGERAAVGPMSLLSARVAELDRKAGRKGRPPASQNRLRDHSQGRRASADHGHVCVADRLAARALCVPTVAAAHRAGAF